MSSNNTLPAKSRPGFFSTLTGKAQREAATELAQTFSQHCPLPGGKRRALSTHEVERALAALYKGAADFSRAGHLGILGRARLAKALQEELLARGYPVDMVLKITHAVAAKSLSGKSLQKPADKPDDHRN